jgi:hypothetical protein
MSMNRQLRRAQEKQDKKQERARADRRAERLRKVRQMQAERERRKKALGEARARGQAGETPEKGGSQPPRGGRGQRDPGRFSGALAIATVVFMVLQGVAPLPPESTLDSVIKAAFYLMFGYFFTMWLYRRNTASAPLVAIISGVLLAAGTWFGAVLREAPQDLLALALTVPLLLAGVWLGRLVSTQPQG